MTQTIEKDNNSIPFFFFSKFIYFLLFAHWSLHIGTMAGWAMSIEHACGHTDMQTLDVCRHIETYIHTHARTHLLFHRQTDIPTVVQCLLNVRFRLFCIHAVGISNICTYIDYFIRNFQRIWALFFLFTHFSRYFAWYFHRRHLNNAIGTRNRTKTTHQL